MIADSSASWRHGLRFRSTARSHPGVSRALNEDRVLDQPHAGLWAVADGMGGHRDGAAASSRLVAALETLAPATSGYARLAEATRRIERINAELHQGAGEVGMSGTTLVMLLVHDGHYACVWAGDSRAYRLRRGELEPLSRDHSVVQELVETGVLGEAERSRHPRAHVLTRAVGAAAELQLEQRFGQAQAEDLFLLCSDGLTNCLSTVAIAAALRSPDLEACADRLLSEALSAGAPDNVSLVLVRAEASFTDG